MIGIFDSGVGGLSVLRHVRALLPQADLLFLADQAHMPYGSRSLDDVRGLTHAAVDGMAALGCGTLVIACNTASAAALRSVRNRHPQLPIVGMEPAVKPARALTRSGVIGVLATQATFQGELFASVVDRHAAGIRVLAQACPGLAEAIEGNDVALLEIEDRLRGWLAPMLAAGADTIVLACTHYPFVLPTITRLCGPGVRVIDPAPAVAAQVARVAGAAALGRGQTHLRTTGDGANLRAQCERLLNGQVTLHSCEAMQL